MNSSGIFVPSIYKKSIETDKLYVVSQSKQELSQEITDYINSSVERLTKPQFETFENEDIKPDYLTLIQELQDEIGNCVKKTGDAMSGPLHILRSPQAKMDAVNKEYVDEKIKTKHSKDLDLNHYKIKNLQSPTDLNDAVNKNYVDQKLEFFSGLKQQTSQHIFSKGQSYPIIKKTFFFNPGFICPQKIHITSVGFSTSPYKYKIGEKNKLGESNLTKLYFMINNEIRSEYTIEKDIQLGHILKEFDDPIVFEKGDNFMMVVESIIEDASVNVTFY